MASLSHGKEVVTQDPNENMLKISELADKGIKVSEDFIAQHGEKLVAESKLGQVLAIKTAEEQQNALRGLLGLKHVVSQTTVDDRAKSAERLVATMKTGEIAQISSIESAENYLEKSIGGSIKGIKNSETMQKIKEEGGEIADKAKDLAESGKVVAVLNWFKNIFKTVLGWLGLDKFFDFGDKVEKVVEKLSPEKIKKTKEKAEKVIIESLGEHLTDENKVKLTKSLENLTEEQLLLLTEKAKSGNLSLTDLEEVVPNILAGIFSKAQLEKAKSDFKKNLIESIKKGVQEKYNHTITDAKLIELEELIKNNTNLSNENIGSLIGITKKQEALFKDVMGPLFETTVNSAAILVGLLVKGIVPIGAFGLDFAKSSGDIVKLSLNSMGITKHITLDTFSKQIDELNPNEKAILVGLLYRKGGLLLNIMGSIGEFVSRIGIESVTKSNVKTFDLLKASFKGNHLKQIENFEKIAKKLNIKTIGDKTGILKEAVGNVEKIIHNYDILNILEKSKGNTGEAIKLLKNKGITIPSGVTINTPFKQLMSKFGSAPVVVADSLRLGGFTSELGFGKNADLFRLNRKIEAVAKSQRRMFNGNILSKSFSKISELLNIGDISRNGDRLVFHFDSIDKAKQSLSKWNIVANKFPDLVKGIFDKLPIIAITGLAASSDKPFFEEFKKELKYIIPIVGPVLLIKDSGISWKNGDINIINPIEAGIGGALIGLDSIFLVKEFMKGKGAGKIIRVGKYMAKPVSDIYSIGKGTVEGAYTIGKAIKGGKGVQEILTSAFKKTKSIKKPKLKTIAILAVIAYLGVEYAFSDDDTLKEFFDENGKIDKEKLQKEINSPEITDEDKGALLKCLIAEKIGEKGLDKIEINIKDNVLKIVSKNDKYQGDWIIEDTLDLLQLEYYGDFEYKA